MQRRFAIAAFFGLCLGCTFDPAVVRPLPPGDGGTDGADVGARDSGSPNVEGDGGGQQPDLPASDASSTPDAVVPVDAGPRDVGGPDALPVPDSSAPDAALPDADMAAPATCNGRVVDLMTDPRNCGVCDNICDRQHGTCQAGACACPAGAEPCGPENRCTVTDWDPLACGTCQTRCEAGQRCTQGVCECRDGLTLCDGDCVDLQSDPSHCGQCGMSCNGDACLDGSCEARQLCPLGSWTCDMPGGKACVRGQTNDLHCNPTLGDPCGQVCPAGDACVDPGLFSRSQCVGFRPGVDCSQCPCADCGNNEVCQDPSGTVAFCLSR